MIRRTPEHEVVRHIAYMGPCPKCGGSLAPADENQDRYCSVCCLTVEHATEWWTIDAKREAKK